MWGSVNGDTHFFGVMDGGLLDPFLGRKNSTPEYFRMFNRDEVLLCKITPKGKPHRSSIVHAHGGDQPKTQVFPEQIVFAAGDAVDIEFWLSNFAATNLRACWRDDPRRR